MPKNLETLKNYYEDMIAKMPGHVFWKDKHGVFLGCNDQQARTLGLKSRYEVVGKTTLDMIWHEQPESERLHQARLIDEADRKIIETGEPQTLEEPLTLPDGTTVIYLSRKSPLYENGKIVGILGISFDITAQKKAERLQQEKDAAEKKIQYLRAAAGSIAHELRTPLLSIRMAAEFVSRFWHALISAYKLAKNAKLNVDEIKDRPMAQLEGRIDSVLQQTRYANAFIDLVLGNLKEETEINKSNYGTYNIADVVNQCLTQYPFAHNENTLIHWCSDNEFEFIGDKFLTINVLNNLIKNALYFIKESRKGEITIWLEQDKLFNRLYFRDTAKGVPSNSIGQLFDSFYSGRQGGTGLGLAFCKKIMKGLGGDINAQSIEGEYMQFILSFPMAAIYNK